MRELKFRAWLMPHWEEDDEANTMYYDIQNSYDMLGDVKPRDPMGSFSNWLNDEDAIVEQCTGIKDKQGTFVYEGDIIQYDGCLYEVFWNQEFAEFEWRHIGPHGWTHVNVLKLGKVIGNIHENPELLEGEQNGR